jgi:co-chaperonin GroES (HSP10)
MRFNRGTKMTLDEAFPKLDPGVKPMGARVLVQFKQTPKKTTASGIILAMETKETEKWNTQVAKVVSMGPLAFKKRDTLEPWPEGAWCSIGDYIRVPKWGGDRIEVPYMDGKDEEMALFAVFNDHECISQITGDPLAIRAFL